MSATDTGPKRLAELLRAGMAKAQSETPAERAAREAALKAQEDAWRKEYAARLVQGWPAHLRACGAPDEAVAALSKPRSQQLTTAAAQAVDEWLASGEPWIVLSGGTGSGKTVGACKALKLATRLEARTGLHLREWDADAGFVLRLDELASWGDFLTPRQAQRWESAQKARVLVLDDVHPARPPQPGEDPEPLSQWGQRRLNTLVETRNRRGFRTAVTTNLSLRATVGPQSSPFARFIREQNFSRIAGNCTVRDTGSRDLRRGGQTEVSP